MSTLVRYVFIYYSCSLTVTTPPPPFRCYFYNTLPSLEDNWEIHGYLLRVIYCRVYQYGVVVLLLHCLLSASET